MYYHYETSLLLVLCVYTYSTSKLQPVDWSLDRTVCEYTAGSEQPAEPLICVGVTLAVSSSESVRVRRRCLSPHPAGDDPKFGCRPRSNSVMMVINSIVAKAESVEQFLLLVFDSPASYSRDPDKRM